MNAAEIVTHSYSMLQTFTKHFSSYKTEHRSLFCSMTSVKLMVPFLNVRIRLTLYLTKFYKWDSYGYCTKVICSLNIVTLSLFITYHDTIVVFFKSSRETPYILQETFFSSRRTEPIQGCQKLYSPHFPK